MQMRHRIRPPDQDGLLRPYLVDLIDLCHELVKLAALIDGHTSPIGGGAALSAARLSVVE
jgi:hypothetical protein